MGFHKPAQVAYELGRQTVCTINVTAIARTREAAGYFFSSDLLNLMVSPRSRRIKFN